MTLNVTKGLFAGFAILSLSACAGVDAVANHGELDVHTHMSETVFLDPVAPSQHTIYLGLRNTSDYPDLDVRSALANALTNRGYKIVSAPHAAHYLLQANVLQAGKLTPQQSSSLLSSSYGQPLQSLALGAGSGALLSSLTNNANVGAGVGLGVAAASALINYAYQDVTYAITVDIQLSERPAHGGKVRQYTHTHHDTASAGMTATMTESTAQSAGVSVAANSSGNHREQDIVENTEFKKYNLRDIAYADKVNLKIQEAMSTLTQHLASSFANLFE